MLNVSPSRIIANCTLMYASPSASLGIESGGKYLRDPSRYAADQVGIHLGSSAFTIISQSATLGVSNAHLPSLPLKSEINHSVGFESSMEDIPAAQVETYYGGSIAYYAPAPRSATSPPFEQETFCTNSPQGCCTMIAIKVLRSIQSSSHSTGPLCIHREAARSSSTLPQPIGNIFATQHEAISKMLSILKCPCSTISSVRILLGAICDSIITESSMLLGRPYSDQFRLQPVRVGIFSSDGPLSYRVCACIILENLQALQSQMNQLLDHPKSEQMTLYEDGSFEMEAAIGRYIDTVVCENLQEMIEQTRRFF